MVGRERQLHAPANLDLSAFDDWHFFSGAQREDSSFRWIDNRHEMVYVEHTEVADTESSLCQIARAELACARTLRNRTRVTRELGNRFLVTVDHDRCQQTTFHGYCNTQVDKVVKDQLVSSERRVQTG